MVNSSLQLKSMLIAGYYLRVSNELLAYCETENVTLPRIVSRDNLYSYPWLFFRLSDTSRVRMVVATTSAPYELQLSVEEFDRYDIIDVVTAQPVVSGVELEQAMHHCPKQLFYNLYQFCSMGCKFCPLSANPRGTSDTLEKMLRDIDKFGSDSLDGIGITSGIPGHSSGNRVAFEMVHIVESLRKKIGCATPIGVSPMCPSREALTALKAAGADEVRINIEIYHHQLAGLLAPRKSLDRTLESISYAVDIFGKGKVSSNMIIGLGEVDEHVIGGVRELAELGAIATLYPYDPVPECEAELSSLTGGRVRRPSAKRLERLAAEHKRILQEFDLDPEQLMTMCPRCAASHIMPAIDF